MLRFLKFVILTIKEVLSLDIYDRIEMLLKSKNMKQSDLAKATGISTGLISQWKKRMQNPSTEKLAAIAEYFDVSVDYLLGNEQKNTPADDDLDEDIKQIEALLKQLDSENLDKAIDYIDLLLNSQDDE